VVRSAELGAPAAARSAEPEALAAVRSEDAVHGTSSQAAPQ